MDSVPRKHVTLELGGNAAAVVCADYASPDDLDWATTRIATFANYQGGQSCVSVQRLLVDRAVYDRVLEQIVDKVAAQVTGDPRDAATDVGPLVNEAAAIRVEAWVDEAVAGGAKVLTGALAAAPPMSPPCSSTYPQTAARPRGRSSARS